jgi:hypothetical protein
LGFQPLPLELELELRLVARLQLGLEEKVLKQLLGSYSEQGIGLVLTPMPILMDPCFNA